ncbi:hypothetical protein [Microbulbifer sp. THAF38]|uniref:hypothetical protein n=1 Tax=Microbulbifer sp. THAF38 TaxID=2587856 RepID=UPI001269782D|nr:hypothetical protein [Microbulbifer sp. THAF38]
MSFSDREKHLIRAAFAWGQITQQEGYTLSDLEIEKSVLFRRLLGGRPALAFPPPLRHGFPWYEVIEGRAEHIVSASETSPECSFIAPGCKIGETCILIDGAFWRVVETISEREEYIVEWGQYPMQWRLKKHWEVNYEMTQQLHSFRRDNPSAKVSFDNYLGQRDYREFRIDDDQTVWLCEWQLSRISLSGWVWVGTLLSPKETELVPVYEDPLGPMILGDPSTNKGAAWLRIEEAGNEARFVKLDGTYDYQSLSSASATHLKSLLHKLQESLEDIEVMDCHGDSPIRRFSLPSALVPLDELSLKEMQYDLVPDNAYEQMA